MAYTINVAYNMLYNWKQVDGYNDTDVFLCGLMKVYVMDGMYKRMYLQIAIF